ncbi:Metallo-hydrolase/oxidoreductase [Aulographum hederae CBS 113979]|uniref:Metallo-hydrolase/oxidoreductase n=1 Tax=Aulographum hederae CBS 113979 TaxID=1176131 RepID=A0A6G1GV44_9PEZI|nr:Metallo-hydrolase/oxidoreductase [Aulographum hederae CBS 113979]
MHQTSTAPERAPALDIPDQGSTCGLSVVDTTCSLTAPSNTLVEPPISGHELMNFPVFAFLIKHSTSGRQLLFDLGCKKDFWNLPPPIADVIDAKVPGIRVDRDFVDVLVDGGVDVHSIEAAIISHHHYDHTGDPSTFPKSMDLIVGPGFSKSFLPGYPTNSDAPAFDNAFEGRTVNEIQFSDDLKVAGYQAHDYFSDGSLYILNTPGHAIGHISALVRTTEDTFVFLGGDICHFGGSIRPTPYVPMPAQFSAKDVGYESTTTSETDLRNRDAAIMYACDLFTACHPHQSAARTTPYYEPCSQGGWYVDPPTARRSIEMLRRLDADERVLVLIAHDPALIGTVPMFPQGNLNAWFEEGVKGLLRWRFLSELPVEGRERKLLVDGTYKDGKRVKDMDGLKV